MTDRVAVIPTMRGMMAPTWPHSCWARIQRRWTAPARQRESAHWPSIAATVASQPDVARASTRTRVPGKTRWETGIR